jgi:hypothetical protein
VDVKGEDSGAEADGEGGAVVSAFAAALVGVVLEESVDGDCQGDGVYGGGGGGLPRRTVPS